MHILFIGPQGSGKGTQAKKVAERFNLGYFAMGDALRETAAANTPLGKKIEEIMNKGELVPTALTLDIIKDKLADSSTDFIFDGFPRSLDQARALLDLCKIGMVVLLEISDEEAMARIRTRLICSSCERGYNTITLKPKQEGVCDVCGGKLIHRHDDAPEAVKHRLELYHQITEPLIAFYEQEKTVIIHINGTQSIEKVFEDIVQSIENVISTSQQS